jgi:ribose transport system permease protein
MSTAEALHGNDDTRPRRYIPDLRISRLSGLYLWVLMIAFFAIVIPDTFLTETTAKGIASDQAITAVIALAALVPLACGCFDLSVAQLLGASAVVCGALMSQQGMSPAAAIVLTLLFGMGVGAINGAVVAWVGVDSLVATLGMSSVLLALTGAITKYQFVGPFPSSFGNLVAGEVVGIPTIVFYMAGVAFLAWYVLEHTPIGRRVHATGAGQDAARLAGIRTKRYVFGSLVTAGLLASVAGILLAAKIGQVGPTAGPSYLLPAFAACFLGTTQLKPGRFNVGGTMLALFLLATGVTGLQLIGGELWITDLFNGVALIVAVSAAVLSSRRTSRRQRREAATA